jgi:NADH-quinone oxidoreductase subunit F
MMGSGGMIIMDENTCMVDVARYFLNFLKDESCGKCLPCREGIKQMLEILNRICEGKGKEGDVELLTEIAHTVQDTALCALGGSAPNPLLTTLRYFGDEYVAHVRDKRCPAGICKDLITYAIQEDKCTGCGACAKACPNGAIKGEKKKPHAISIDLCTKCGICSETCRQQAIAAA